MSARNGVRDCVCGCACGCASLYVWVCLCIDFGHTSPLLKNPLIAFVRPCDSLALSGLLMKVQMNWITYSPPRNPLPSLTCIHSLSHILLLLLPGAFALLLPPDFSISPPPPAPFRRLDTSLSLSPRPLPATLTSTLSDSIAAFVLTCNLKSGI